MAAYASEPSHHTPPALRKPNGLFSSLYVGDGPVVQLGSWKAKAQEVLAYRHEGSGAGGVPVARPHPSNGLTRLTLTLRCRPYQIPPTRAVLGLSEMVPWHLNVEPPWLQAQIRWRSCVSKP